MKFIKLNNGVEMPMQGIGTFLLSPDEAEASATYALKNGCQLIDTANAYCNEKAVGRAMKNAGIDRKNIFLETKLWPSFYEQDDAVDKTLERLQTDYIDLLLIHQPAGNYIAGYKQMEKAYKDGKKAFVLYCDGKYTLMTLKDTSLMEKLMPTASKALRELDVSVLHTLVLERIFGIDKENMANQKNLTYTRVLDEAIEAVDNGSADCSFILNPTRVSEIRDVALAGEKMPQKSTYFYPKLTTGLVMNKIFD